MGDARERMATAADNTFPESTESNRDVQSLPRQRAKNKAKSARGGRIA